MSKNSPPPQNLVYKDKKIILNIHNYNIIARATYSGVSCAKIIVLATATRKSCVLPRAKLDFCFSTAQRIFAIKTRRTKPPAAVSQDCLLGVGVLRTHFSYHRRGSGIAQTAPRLWQPPQMSFRGAKRRGNPLNRNSNTVAVAIDLACFRNH